MTQNEYEKIEDVQDAVVERISTVYSSYTLGVIEKQAELIEQLQKSVGLLSGLLVLRGIITTEELDEMLPGGFSSGNKLTALASVEK